MRARMGSGWLAHSDGAGQRYENEDGVFVVSHSVYQGSFTNRDMNDIYKINKQRNKISNHSPPITEKDLDKMPAFP